MAVKKVDYTSVIAQTRKGNKGVVIVVVKRWR